MRKVLRLAIVDPNDGERESLKKILLGMDRVWLEAECSRYEFFADVVEQTSPDIGFIALDEDPEKGVRLAATLREKVPDCSILVSSHSTDGGLILKAMRAGVKEFLTQPLGIEELVAALDRVGDQRFGSDGSRAASSSVIAVAGVTGGVGSTSIAVNLGCALAADQKHTAALVDLDLCLGDADVFLDTIPDYTIVDVAQNVQRLDINLLKRSLTKHSSGLYLLPRPMQLEDVKFVSDDAFQRVMGLLKATFTHLILDTSKAFTPIDLAAMQMADHVLLVTQLDVPCLRNIVRLMASFKEMDDLADKVKVIINRAGLDGGQISLKKAEETIGAEIFWQLPNEYKTMVEVRNNGVPLIEQAPKANITQAINGLAEALCGENANDDDGKQKRGLLGLFAAKAKAGR